jgi:DNA-binding transcriptional ArsR family regulator
MADDADPRPPAWDPLGVERMLLAVPNRRRITEHIRRHAGVHLRQVARDLDLAIGTVEHHLHLLEQHGLVQRRRAGGHACYFAADEGPEDSTKGMDWRLLAVLRRRPQRLILRAMAAQATLSLAEVAQRSGISPSTTAYHVRALTAAGHVEALRLGNRRLLRAAHPHALADALAVFDAAQPVPAWPGAILQAALSVPTPTGVRTVVKDRPPRCGAPSDAPAPSVGVAVRPRSSSP